MKHKCKYTSLDYHRLTKRHKELLEILPELERHQLLELRLYIQYRQGNLDREFKSLSFEYRAGNLDNPEQVQRMRLASATLRSANRMVATQLKIYDELHQSETQDFSVQFQQTASEVLTVQTYNLIVSRIRK